MPVGTVTFRRRTMTTPKWYIGIYNNSADLFATSGTITKARFPAFNHIIGPFISLDKAQAHMRKLSMHGYRKNPGLLKIARRVITRRNPHCGNPMLANAQKRIDRLLRNPPTRGGTVIYDRIEAIEAKKGRSSPRWAGEKFRHKFKPGAKVIGMPDGSLVIKGPKRLWKKFRYD